jgi:hypothetical protein
MYLQQTYLWSKKIHKWAMWAIMLLGIPMAISGLALHKIVEGEGGWIPLDPELIRFLHGKLSNPFAIILAIMMITGFLMWALPKILSRKAQSKLS